MCNLTRYLIRLDDACPTDKIVIWDALESMFDKYNIKPLISVIPQCKDKSISYTHENEAFWERIRRYQGKGYSIGMHGFNHVFTTKCKGLVPMNAFSEFAGLPLSVQRDKIKKGFHLMISHRVRPNVWVAPGHSFDENTLLALKNETDIEVVSDGIALFPYKKFGFLWIPQQLWSLKPFFLGFATVCLHPNLLVDRDCKVLNNAFARYAEHIVTFESVINDERYINRNKDALDMVFENLFYLNRFIKKDLHHD